MRDKTLWSKWQCMKQRCSNPNDISYKYYGGRGISVCEEWKNSYQAFCEWAMNNGYNTGLSLDRIDNDKNYCPENCRWVPLVEQKRNKRSAHYITINGETKFLAEWARVAGINPRTIYRRLDRGLSGEDLICKGPVTVIRLIGGQDG